MPGRQAKLISSAVLRRMLRHVQQRSHDPARDRVMILLSVRAGLRAAEIAQLRWSMVLDARGRIGDNCPELPELGSADEAVIGLEPVGSCDGRFAQTHGRP
jgi:hypothetical protein